MSASTERLVEQIRLTEEALEVARRDSDVRLIVEIERDLKQLQRTLAASNEALVEGRQILKG